MRPLSRVTLALALVALVGGGCVSGGGRRVPLFGEPEEKLILRFEVTNNNANDATVHALYQGTRRRLGTVTGKGKGVFTLEWPNSQPVALEIDFLAGGTCTTREITASPGEELQFLIPVNESSTCDGAD